VHRLAIVAAFMLPLGALAGPPPPPPATQPAKGTAAPKAPGSGATAPAAKPSQQTPPAPSGGTPPPPSGTTAPGEPDAREPVDDKPVDLSDTWHYSKQRPRAPRYQPDRPTLDHAPNPTGYYSGVSVSGNHVPPFPAKQMGTRPVVLTWIGFERVSGGSRVFFEVNGDVAFETTRQGLVLRIKLANTKINMRNNARVLDLRYFQTPVRTAKLSRRGRDTIATIALKRDAEPKVELVQGNVGYKLLVVSFGSARSDAEADAAEPAKDE
jgi:hypothetical protein